MSEELNVRFAAAKADLSHNEVLARLILSETLSTGYWKNLCTADAEDEIMILIGWGIINRLKSKSSDAYYNVIFAKNQFRTSFSSKRKNPFAEAFLCPLKAQAYLEAAPKMGSAAELYKKARAIADELVTTYDQSGIPKDYQGITNFFYPYSEFFGEKRPLWAANKDPKKNKGYLSHLNGSKKPCVEAYQIQSR